MVEKLHPVHPGEVLLEEFIKPMNLSQNRLAIEIGIDARRVNEIVLGDRSVPGQYRFTFGALLWGFATVLARFTGRI